ncbi:MAG: PLP-dependent aminotransferase family protein [Magnetospirillum sp.]
MSNWLPDLSVHSGPKYRAIVESISADMANGVLVPGTRMPTHRDLAWRLKVTVGTVARAYAEAEHLGLLSGEVGRGTFVTDPARREAGLGQYLAVAWAPHPGIINMAVNRPSGDQGAWAVGPALAQLAKRPDLSQLLSYNLEVVAQRHRAAGCKWLAREGAAVPEEQVTVTAGSQQALVACIATLTRPGDTILAEEYTYPGFKSAVQLLGRSLAGVMMDDEGLIPDEVERGFARGARLLYTTATVQNPTTSTLSEGRRRAIAEAARRYDAYIVEDGVHRFLEPNAPESILVHAPERTLYLTTLSKSVTPGLRCSFSALPPAIKPRYDQAVGALSLALPVPLLEVASMLINDGTAQEAAERQRRDAAARIALAGEILGIDNLRPAFNVWLPMTLPWTSSAFIAEAARRAVSLPPTDSFAVGRPHLDGVRASVTAPPDMESLAQALRVLAELRDCPVSPVAMTV